MELVGAALGGHDDRCARTASVFRRIRVGNDLELLDRVHRLVHYLRAQLLDVFRDGVIVHAIEDEIVLERADAMNVDAAGAARRRAAALLRVAVARHTRHRLQQVVPIAQAQGQVEHHAVLYDRAGRGLLRFERCGCGRHFHHLGYFADLEVKVIATSLADFQHDVVMNGSSESVRFYGHGESPDGQRREQVITRCVGSGPLLDIRRLLFGRDRGASNHRSRGIGHQAREAGILDLCQHRRGQHQP